MKQYKVECLPEPFGGMFSMQAALVEIDTEKPDWIWDKYNPTVVKLEDVEMIHNEIRLCLKIIHAMAKSNEYPLTEEGVLIRANEIEQIINTITERLSEGR